MVQYFQLVQVLAQMILPDTDKIIFASTLLKDNATVWWYTLKVADQIPTTWAEFEAVVRGQIVLEDHNRRASGQLRQCRQKGSVSAYIPSFRNVALLVDDIIKGENWDRFVDGQKPRIAYDRGNENCMSFTDVLKLALRV